MPRIRLVHWRPDESAAAAARIAGLGYEVDNSKLQSSSLKEFRNNPPDAVVIDLSRLPSHGREVGLLLRKSPKTRLIPLVFAEGDPDKVDLVKRTIPDARYVTYENIGPVLADVLAHPVREAFVPQSLSWFDSPTPLPKKLGVRDGMTIGLIQAPEGFEAHLPGAQCRRNPRGKVNLTLWFFTSRADLEAALPRLHERAVEGGVWVIWPKKASGIVTGLDSNLVREICLAAGLVDFKICSVDATWTGMRFAVKR